MEQHESPAASASLLAAQQKLAQLRQACRHQRLSAALPIHTDEHGRALHPTPTPASQPPTLPTHLGWGSHPLTTALRRHLQAKSPISNPQSPNLLIPAPPLEPENPKSKIQNPKSDTVRLYPDLALAILKHRAAAPGRIWLLLQHLDTTGQGWLSLSDTRRHLTHDDSSLRVCGWRQLRALLAQGEGIYWQQNNGRLWLRSTAKVAATFTLTHLTSRPINLPIRILLGRIGQLRAHLYATFHSARSPQPDQPAMPIARATLNRLSGVSRRTQRTYERRAGVRRQANLALSPAGPHQTEEIAWQRGRALFHFTDAKGKIGRPGATYLAWQLPNSYTGPHYLRPQSGQSRQKRINRELVDLFQNGMTGNGKRAPRKRFYDNPARAARSYNRNPHQESYWHSRPPGRHQNRLQLWHLLPAQAEQPATRPACPPSK